MPRKKCQRRISHEAAAAYYKPAGIPMRELDDVVLEADEIEALNLSDLEGLYHEDAARKMNISRQTFGRIIASARKKTAEALVLGKAIRLAGRDG